MLLSKFPVRQGEVGPHPLGSPPRPRYRRIGFEGQGVGATAAGRCGRASLRSNSQISNTAVCPHRVADSFDQAVRPDSARGVAMILVEDVIAVDRVSRVILALEIEIEATKAFPSHHCECSRQRVDVGDLDVAAVDV